MGSPPRGRGKACPCTPQVGYSRITPSWAGKRPAWRRSRWPWRDHPRVGGEKEYTELDSVRRLGSPPRGRGKVHQMIEVINGLGITPAWAGKSWPSACAWCCNWDHPPRGRGKDKSGGEGGTLRRITPAQAGKRPCSSKRPTPSRDHPRVGGEKGYPCRKKSSGRGSPPRGRGKDR